MTKDCQSGADRARRRGFAIAGIALAGGLALSAAYALTRQEEAKRPQVSRYEMGGAVAYPDPPPR